MPIRVQRKRTKGWKMPENTVYVGRGSKWGNPFSIGKENIFNRTPIDNDGAVGCFEDMLQDKELLALCGYPVKDIYELMGKNLACWCPLDKPCHADILLKLANPTADK